MDRPHEATAAHAPRGEGAAGRSAPVIEAAVVAPAPGQGAAYLMYEVESMSADGATLTRGLLLEKGEELTLELRLPDRGVARARVRVVDITPGAGTMRVAFVGLEDADRQRLSRHIAPTQRSHGRDR